MTGRQPPWPPERWPSAAEWVDWMLTLPREDQEAAAERSLEARHAAVECFIRHSQGADAARLERVDNRAAPRRGYLVVEFVPGPDDEQPFGTVLLALREKLTAAQIATVGAVYAALGLQGIRELLTDFTAVTEEDLSR